MIYKIFFCLIVIGIVSSFNGFAQELPPPPSRRNPPPPLIYTAPLYEEIEEFSSLDKSFIASFPGKPKVEERDLGAAKTATYRVYRKGSNSTVNITEYREDLSSRTDEAFKLIREGIRNTPRSRIEAETEIELDGRKGKEFRIDLTMQYRIVRIFIVGKRVFEIQSDVTNWHIIGEKTKEEWRKETDRFFSSFRIR